MVAKIIVRTNVVLHLSYKGTCFYGWQSQKNLPTIQDTLEKAISACGLGPVRLCGSGRTDAGVHALDYVANFLTEKKLPAARIKEALNAHLPDGIRVTRVEKAPAVFHSRYHASSKVYRYLIADRFSPFLENTAWVVRDPVDVKKMKDASSLLLGEKDFSSFQSSGSCIRNAVRTVKSISIHRTHFTLDPSVKIISVEIEATGFLYRMARNMVGLLVEAGRGRLSLAQVSRIIAAKDRRLAPPPAPADGLYLKKVCYPKRKRNE